jgi:DNA-directed RNA polymerase specialized sigma24 family protein
MGVRNRTESVSNLLLRLPPQHRYVLSLYNIEGFDIAEVARSVRIPEGEEKVHVRRYCQTNTR